MKSPKTTPRNKVKNIINKIYMDCIDFICVYDGTIACKNTNEKIEIIRHMLNKNSKNFVSI